MSKIGEISIFVMDKRLLHNSLGRPCIHCCAWMHKSGQLGTLEEESVWDE